MKYGIVQEVMKIEERKAIRRENANKAAIAAEAAANSEHQDTTKSPAKFGGAKSPRTTTHLKKNSDLAGVSNSRYSNDQINNNKRPKTFLDYQPPEKSRGRGAIHDSQMSEFSRSPKKDYSAIGSAMKDTTMKHMGGMNNSTTTFQTIGGGESKKKAINFGDNSTDNGRPLPRVPAAKNAPTKSCNVSERQ